MRYVTGQGTHAAESDGLRPTPLPQTGPGGAWNLDAVCNFSQQMRSVFQDGISFEVLSWRIMIEEPVGTCARISAALNDPQSRGVATHEMEALKKGVLDAVDRIAKSSAVAGQVDYPIAVVHLHRCTANKHKGGGFP